MSLPQQTLVPLYSPSSTFLLLIFPISSDFFFFLFSVISQQPLVSLSFPSSVLPFLSVFTSLFFLFYVPILFVYLFSYFYLGLFPSQQLLVSLSLLSLVFSRLICLHFVFFCFIFPILSVHPLFILLLFWFISISTATGFLVSILRSLSYLLVFPLLPFSLLFFPFYQFIFPLSRFYLGLVISQQPVVSSALPSIVPRLIYHSISVFFRLIFSYFISSSSFLVSI